MAYEASLVRTVLAHALRTPEAPAISAAAGRLTYSDLAERVAGLAGHLAARGVRRGDRVLVALPNTPATIVVGLAIQSLGAIPAEVNRSWGEAMLRGSLQRSRARHLVVWGRDARTWGPILGAQPPEALWVVHGGPVPDAMRQALGPASPALILEDGRVDPAVEPVAPVEASDPAPDDVGLILFTSGSTGAPHGVMQTHRNIDANTRSIVEYLGLGPADRAMLTLPLYYCYGRSVLQTHLFVGGSVVLDNRFALPGTVIDAMRDEACTGFAGVPLTFEILRRSVDLATADLPALRYMTQAGGAMSPDLTAWVRDAIAPAPLYVMYGQTEATARLSWLPPDRAVDKAGSIGIPIPGVELRVVGADGAELAVGEVGELVARGDNVTLGYLDEPEATRAILHDGWLWTGDLAYRDGDGFLFHRGRARELIKVGGHRVSPGEIEQVVAGAPGILEVGVCGMPDGLLGEVPVAWIVTTSEWEGEATLRRHCRERLASHAVPAEFIVVDRLPRNEAGKLLRAELPSLVAAS